MEVQMEKAKQRGEASECIFEVCIGLERRMKALNTLKGLVILNVPTLSDVPKVSNVSDISNALVVPAFWTRFLRYGGASLAELCAF